MGQREHQAVSSKAAWGNRSVQVLGEAHRGTWLLGRSGKTFRSDCELSPENEQGEGKVTGSRDGKCKGPEWRPDAML